MNSAEQWKEQVQQFWAQLKLAPIVNLRGVVARASIGASQSPNEELRDFTLVLDAWRIENDAVETRPLIVRKQASEGELRSFCAHMAHLTVVHIRARVKYSELIGFEALYESFVGIDTADHQLNKIAHELRQPVFINTPPLPPLALSEYSWDGSIVLDSWAGFRISPNTYNDYSAGELSDGSNPLTLKKQEKIEKLEDKRRPPSHEQAAAYEFLVANEQPLYKAVMQAIFDEYPTLQDAYGIDESDAAEVMPNIENPEQLRSLTRLTGVTISNKAKEGIAYVGFDFECAWDPEHGFGVALHKDIVLEVADSNCVWWVAQNDLEKQDI